jgi:hypothetical protein
MSCIVPEEFMQMTSGWHFMWREEQGRVDTVLESLLRAFEVEPAQAASKRLRHVIYILLVPTLADRRL